MGSAVRSVLSSEVTAAERGSGGPSKGQRVFLLEPPEGRKGTTAHAGPPCCLRQASSPRQGHCAHRAGEGRSSSSHGTVGATLGPWGVHSQARVQRVPRAEAAGAPGHGISRRTPARGSLGPRRCLLTDAHAESRLSCCRAEQGEGLPFRQGPGARRGCGAAAQQCGRPRGLAGDGRSGAPARSPEAGARGEGPADPDALASLSIAWSRPWSRSGHFCLPRTG